MLNAVSKPPSRPSHWLPGLDEIEPNRDSMRSSPPCWRATVHWPLLYVQVRASLHPPAVAAITPRVVTDTKAPVQKTNRSNGVHARHCRMQDRTGERVTGSALRTASGIHTHRGCSDSTSVCRLNRPGLRLGVRSNPMESPS